MSDDRPLLSISEAEDRIALSGELDLTTVPLLQEALAAANGAPDLAIDLSDLTFIDSSGLHAIVGFAQARQPNTVTLANASPFLHRLFEITRIAEIPNLRVDG